MPTPPTNLRYDDDRELSRSVVRISGRAQPNGSGTIDNTQNVPVRGLVFTRTGVGVVTVQVMEPARSWFEASLELSSATLLNRRCQLTAFSQGTDGTWTFTFTLTDLNNAGVVAVEFPATASATWLLFRCKVQLVAP